MPAHFKHPEFPFSSITLHDRFYSPATLLKIHVKNAQASLSGLISAVDVAVADPLRPFFFSHENSKNRERLWGMEACIRAN